MRVSSATSSAGTNHPADIADLLHELEYQLDAAFATGAKLAAALVAIRQARGLSRVVGHAADRGIAAAMGHIGEAQNAVVESHRLVDRLAPKLGIDPAMYGDSGDYPDYAAATTGQLAKA